MNQLVRIREIPPDLRVALLACFRPPYSLRLASGRVVGPGRPPAPDTPSYLAVTDRARGVDAGGLGVVDLSGELLELVRAGALVDLLPTESALICVLEIWDRSFRELGLFRGNVYLASEQAAADLLRVAGAHDVTAAAVAQVLDDLQAVELIYRFPAARKFRGAFGADNQCRLNGWGRRLALRHPHPSANHWADAIRQHLETHSRRYGDVLAEVTVASDASEGDDLWRRVQELPVGIVV